MSARKTMQDELLNEDAIEHTGDAEAVATTKAPAKTSTTARPKSGETFDPTQYLSNFDGRDYLEVKWRVL